MKTRKKPGSSQIPPRPGTLTWQILQNRGTLPKELASQMGEPRRARSIASLRYELRRRRYNIPKMQGLSKRALEIRELMPIAMEIARQNPRIMISELEELTGLSEEQAGHAYEAACGKKRSEAFPLGNPATGKGIPKIETAKQLLKEKPDMPIAELAGKLGITSEHASRLKSELHRKRGLDVTDLRPKYSGRKRRQ